MARSARAKRLTGGTQYLTAAITNPPFYPNPRVAADAIRTIYTVAQLTPLVGIAAEQTVQVKDLNGATAEWVLGDTTPHDGVTVIGNTLQGRWQVYPSTGGGGGGLTEGSLELTIAGSGTIAHASLGTANYMRTSAASVYTSRGVTATNNPTVLVSDKTFFHVGPSDLVWTNEDGAAAAKDRVRLPGGISSYTQKANTTIQLKRNFAADGGVGRWEMQSVASIDGFVISDLATRTIVKAGEPVTLSGRNTRNDGAGFLVTGELGASDTVDNVNVFSAPNGRYKRTHGWGRNLKFGREVNLLEDFGVVADGTNQAARIQEALDWYNAQANTWLGAHALGNVVMGFYLPGTQRAVRIDAPLTVYGGNHKKTVFRGDGHLATILSPHGHVDWNDEYVCAGSVIQAGGPDAGNFDLFAFPNIYTYLDVSRMGFGNRGNGSCLRAIAAVEANTVIRVDDVLCFGGKVGYWPESTVTCLSNYDLSVRGCDIGVQLGNRVITDYNREAWDIKFYGARLEGNNYGIAIHAAASVYFYGGLVQSNGRGIWGHADYTMGTSGFLNLHVEGNTVKNFDLPEFTTNPGGVNRVMFHDPRMANPESIQLPFGWNLPDGFHCNGFTWPEEYGPNRATFDAFNVTDEVRGVVFDLSSGKKQVIGSIPTRFTSTKRRYRVTIGGSSNGTYQILVNAVSRATYTASGATVQQIRDDLLADLVSWGGCGATAVSTNAIDIDSPLYDGAAFVVTQSSTGSAITVGTVSNFIALDALACGNFIEIDNIAAAFTLFAPIHAPQGFQAVIRFRMNGTGFFPITLSGFSYGTQRFTNSGNGPDTESHLYVGFDDQSAWGVMQFTGWAGASYDPSVVLTNKLTVYTENDANNLSLATAAVICENPTHNQSIYVNSFGGTVVSGTRASNGGYLSHFCGSGTYHQWYATLDTSAPICNMAAGGVHVGGTGTGASACQFQVTSQATTKVTARLKSIASQTADLLQLDSSSGTGDLLAIDKNGVPCYSTADGITASTTQTQGQQPLTAHFNDIATVANANDTVTLMDARRGAEQVVRNSGANILQIFPASGDNHGAGLNTATTLAAGSTATFRAIDGTNWRKSVST